ncbi:MAG: ABC transporter permease [Actinomycetota bacterium]|nr:ABC transporter permease [Actinomycetota bacterium]
MKVLRLVGVRVALVVPIMLGVTTLTFFVTRVLAGDPTELYVPMNATQEFRDQVRADLGLDQPLVVQYGDFVSGFVRGDLGTSATTGRAVVDDLVDRLPATAELALAALVIAIVLGVPAGVLAAAKQDSALDYAIRGSTLVGMALPSFWLGLVLLLVFFVNLGWLPGPVGRLPIGMDEPDQVTGLLTVDALLDGDLGTWWEATRHLLLPAVTLGLVGLAPIARVARNEMVDALGSPYVRTAHATGIRPWRVNLVYALRNALLPVVTMIGGVVGFLFSGAILVENVFGWPGLGQYALAAITRSDFDALQGFVLWSAALFVLTYLVVDVLYLVIDPRTR